MFSILPARQNPLGERVKSSDSRGSSDSKRFSHQPTENTCSGLRASHVSSSLSSGAAAGFLPLSFKDSPIFICTAYEWPCSPSFRPCLHHKGRESRAGRLSLSLTLWPDAWEGAKWQASGRQHIKECTLTMSPWNPPETGTQGASTAPLLGSFVF